MSDDTARTLGKLLVDNLLSDTITPRVLLDQVYGLLSPGNAAVRKEVEEYWSLRNRDRVTSDKPRLDATHPLHLSRGFGTMVAEEELKHYMPEEKILINKEIFRTKLEKVDFATLDSARERVLIDELRNESIGLTREDTVLYFNLIKINKLARESRGTENSKEEPVIDYADWIQRQTETLFGLDKETLTKMNNGRPIDPQLIKVIIHDGIKSGRINPRIMVNWLGMNTPKFVERLKDFLKLVVSQRDGNVAEINQHFGIYLLLNGTKPELLAKLQLSAPLETFVTDRIGRVRQIYYVAMLFAYAFSYVLFVQVFEIAGKFEQSSDDQRAKIRKLYESEERLAMLVTNAVNIASRKTAAFKVEAREIQGAIKKFLVENKHLVTAADLFGASYDIH